jgi:hypothetical protein
MWLAVHKYSSSPATVGQVMHAEKVQTIISGLNQVDSRLLKRGSCSRTCQHVGYHIRYLDGHVTWKYRYILYRK